MKCDENLIQYLNANFSTCEILDLLKKNTLYTKFIDKFINKRSEEKGIVLNRILNSINISVACNIFSDLDKMNIEYISFKGFVLSQILYGSLYERTWGDIDFFVKPLYFNRVYSYLHGKGFKLLDNDGVSNPHHVVLVNSKIVLELHRNLFHPMIGVNEDFLKGCLQVRTVNFQNIITFNETGGILHLIYHIYMDTFLVSDNLYSVITGKMIPKAERFLYRAYEIALYSEKYFCKIEWKKIEDDLKHQKLRIIFRKMVADIVEIFPNAFPDSFLKTVFQLNYIENFNDYDIFCKYVIAANRIKGKYSIDGILCKYINDFWLTHKHNNIYIKIGDFFTIKADDETLSCEVRTAKINDGIKLCFSVTDDELYCSDVNNFNTLASDGIHLILCGTMKYSYHSIFFFPKRNNEIIEVVTVNVLNSVNEVIEEKYICAELIKTRNGYSVICVLTNRFIEMNSLWPYFYMGFVISDCNTKTKLRQRNLILTKDKSQWFNPSYYARIDM